jgi:hypothetical protein
MHKNESIIDYSIKVAKLVEKANACLPENQSLREQEIFSYFVNGLTYEKKVKVIDTGKKTIKEIVEHLTNIEEMTTLFADLTIKPMERKYCELHGSGNHSTEECFSKRNFNRNKQGFKKPEQTKKESDTKSESKTHYLREPNRDIESIKITLSIENIELKALIDTGSQRNIIALKDIQSTKIKKENFLRLIE